MVWKRVAARGGKDPGTSRDRDEGHRPGERGRSGGVPASGSFGAGHSPTSASEPPGPGRPLLLHYTATEQVRIGTPFGQEPLPYPRKTSVRASRVTCGVTCRSKAHVSGRKQANPGD
jgi:hypothetical protein